MAPTRLDENIIRNNNNISKNNKANNGFLTDDHFQIPIIIRTDKIENDYNLDARPFARGKYAQVRRCRHKKTGIEYAAKVIKRRRRTTDVRHEILHEIRVLLMAADNDRIVKLHEVFETTTEFILLLEMVEGGELQRVLDEEDSMDEQQVIKLMKQLLEAIRFLHDNNIAHLDIKPQNILLCEKSPELSIKLCDFGISRFIAEGSELREIVGTPDYVAPEILHFEPIHLATDMWSVGILAYVLLSGYSPFGGETKQETFHNITNEKLDFPKEYFDGVSECAKDFIRRLLEKKAENRMTYKQCLEHEWLSKETDAINAVPSSLNTVIIQNSVSNANITVNSNIKNNEQYDDIENKENISLKNANIINCTSTSLPSAATINTSSTLISSSSTTNTSSNSPSSTTTSSANVLVAAQYKKLTECEFHSTQTLAASEMIATVEATATSVVVVTTEINANKLFNNNNNNNANCTRKTNSERCGALNSPNASITSLKSNLNYENYTSLKKHSLAFHEEKSEERVGIACQ